MIATLSRIGLKDAAAQFSVSYTAVYEAVRAGDLPAIRPFRSWLVKPEDVEAWLQARHDASADR